MFFLKSKVKLAGTDFFDQFTDYHSHILPGVDDGLKSIDDALETLDYYEQLGVNHVFLTPHIGIDFKSNLFEHQEVLDRLSSAYTGSVELSLAGEYMLDLGFRDKLDDGLRYLYGNRVLVETSYAASPNYLNAILYNLLSSGSVPVIAHPERYLYMGHQQYNVLKACGYEFQLNLLSLAGFYGVAVAKNAEYLLERGMYDFCGTDIHNLDKFKVGIDKLKISRKLLGKLFEVKCNQELTLVEA
ncbi:MAG: CpsB/CapC family capsule biosynthesis tyrosine phosphatase [Rikenellaceae bacterium]